MIWQRYPVFRIFLSQCTGILLANFFNLSFLPFTFLFAISLIVVLSFGFLDQSKTVYRYIYSSFLILLFLATGVLSTHLYSGKVFRKHLNNPPSGSRFFLLQITDQPKEKERSFGMPAKLLAYQNEDSLIKKDADMMLYLQKSKGAKKLSYGNRLWVRSEINELLPPKNPYEFDYRNYLNLKSVYYQVYADSTSWEKANENHGYWLVKRSIELRLNLLEEIQEWDISEQEKTVTKALLLGYRSDIDDDLLKAYSAAGAMHVLAVSGLHVGIVYLVFSYLLFFLKKIKRGNIIRTLILVLLLWGYALITGLSPSVVRAATMFTFVAVGTGFRRTTSIYNTLLASAVFLLLIKPTYLFEVGFQLSYAAVFGIVWMQPHFERLWRPRNWLVRQIWAITTVSLAAQIATFPLGLYYFHQFPSLFLVSNLIVIPLVTVLMYSGLLTLALSVTGILPIWLLKTYASILWLMNSSVKAVESFGFFLIDSIHINRLELVVIYLIILTSFSWLIAGKAWKLFTALTAVVFIVGYQILENDRLLQQQMITVYSVPKYRAIGMYWGNEGVFLADSALLADEDALTFHTKHHWWALNIKHFYLLNINDNHKGQQSFKENDLIWFTGNNLRLYRSEITAPRKKEIWLVYHKYSQPPKEIPEVPELVILGNQIKYKTLDRWVSWSEENSVKIHLLDSGALSVNL